MPPLTKCLHRQNVIFDKMALLANKTIGKMSFGTKMTNFGEIVTLVTRQHFLAKFHKSQNRNMSDKTATVNAA